MIIDAHGHYTTVPPEIADWRSNQLDGSAVKPPRVTDDRLRESVLDQQIRLQDERGIDLTILSPRASAMDHHRGDSEKNAAWARLCNDTVRRVCEIFPTRFAFACQLPQHPAGSPAEWARELRRYVEAGAVGCLLNPDPSGGRWTSPPLTDPYWFPIYEAMIDLDVPAMIHVSASSTPALHATGALYLNADTAAFMQLVEGDLFTEYPDLRLIIPHGGGAVPYHWGRFRGLAQGLGRPPLESHVLANVFVDTCVYHQGGIDLLFETLPLTNVLFASEMIGAVRGVDPTSGHSFDDTRRYVEAAITDPDARHQVFEANARRVFSRLAPRPGR